METLKDFNIVNKRILVRCDFNVPLDEKGNILDDFRIKQTLPTIQYLIESKAKIILMSHLGEPDGKVVPELKLDKVAEKITEYLNFPIVKADDCIGLEVENKINRLEVGRVLLLENLRFHKEETLADLEFAKKLSSLGDIYVNDAFGVCHRNHASITGVPQFLSHCMGFLLEKEISNLKKIMENPEKPMAAIVGGKKVEIKSKVINSLSKAADFVIINGLIAKEVVEKNIKFNFPEKIITPVGELSALDINEESIKIFREKILTAETILWNGAFGKIEEERYAVGTLAVANAIIESKAFSVVGGGETVEFLNKQGIIHKFSWVSTGGGAMLSYLTGEGLPGLKALS